MNNKELKETFEKDKRIYDSALLTFHGADGLDVYNCSIPFTGTDGRRYMYGRVEDPQEWANSFVRLFVETGKDDFTVVPNSMIYQLEDPYIQKIGEEWVLGGTHVRKSKGKVDTYYGYFFRGTPEKMTYFTTGPDYMKDIRLVQLADGKIGVFSRPRGGTYAGGAKSMIGFTVIEKLDDLDAKVVEEAPYIEGLFDEGEWGGVNQAYLLSSGKIGVIGHMSYSDCTSDGVKLSVYINASFVYCPETHSAEHFKVIGTKSCYPDCPPKRPHLADCVFTGGIVMRTDGKADLYSGVGDAFEGRITIDYPFEGCGEILQTL